MFKFLVFSALVAVACAIDIPFNTCPGLPSPTSVSIPQCSAVPCGLNPGDSFTLNFNIVTGNVAALPTLVTIEHNGETATFPLPTGDACAAIVGGCPLSPGEHTVSFPVTLNGVSAGTSTITMNMRDENGDPVACGSVTTDFGL